MINRCRKCVMPDTRPDTPFVDGVCQACINYEARDRVDWIAAEDALRHILDEARRETKATGRQYDCVVASSGGKDSHWQVKTLLDYGVKPLIVTAQTCHPTTIGQANIANLQRYADTIVFAPDTQVRARLNRHALETVGDISWPEHALIFSTPIRLAERMGIDLVFYGENPQREYGGPPGSEEAREMTRRWVTEFGGFLGLRPSDFVDAGVATAAQMAPYQPHPVGAASEALFLGAFLPWDSLRNAETAYAMGMKSVMPTPANRWSHENLDNAQTGLHDHLMYRKYGYGRLATQISVEIRMGRISRQDAMTMVRARDGQFPWHYMDVSIRELLLRIDMLPSELADVMDRFTNWDIFERRTVRGELRPPTLLCNEGA